MSLELIFLGTGTSAGVPMIGCDCPVCTSSDPRNRRTRPSVLVRYPGYPGHPDTTVATRTILIDTAPELREQALRQHLHRLDGVFYTHAHADHMLGIDDLRRFNAVMKAPLDIYAEASVIDRLGQMFSYIFQSQNNINPTFVANLIAHPVEVGDALPLFGATWTPLRLMHGRLPIMGFRVDHAGRSLAYCTDVSAIPPETYPLLDGLDVLVIDALRYRHHPTHLTVEQALEIAERVGAKTTYFTHMSHDVDHAELETQLPSGVHVSYDGLRVQVGQDL